MKRIIEAMQEAAALGFTLYTADEDEVRVDLDTNNGVHYRATFDPNPNTETRWEVVAHFHSIDGMTKLSCNRSAALLAAAMLEADAAMA